MAMARWWRRAAACRPVRPPAGGRCTARSRCSRRSAPAVRRRRPGAEPPRGVAGLRLRPRRRSTAAFDDSRLRPTGDSRRLVADVRRPARVDRRRLRVVAERSRARLRRLRSSSRAGSAVAACPIVAGDADYESASRRSAAIASRTSRPPGPRPAAVICASPGRAARRASSSFGDRIAPRRSSPLVGRQHRRRQRPGGLRRVPGFAEPVAVGWTGTAVNSTSPVNAKPGEAAEERLAACGRSRRTGPGLREHQHEQERDDDRPGVDDDRRGHQERGGQQQEQPAGAEDDERERDRPAGRVPLHDQDRPKPSAPAEKSQNRTVPTTSGIGLAERGVAARRRSTADRRDQSTRCPPARTGRAAAASSSRNPDDGQHHGQGDLRRRTAGSE